MSDPVTRLNAALEGRYRIEREIGEGGMATVYLADDLRHERRVALKVLKPDLVASMGPDRFLREYCPFGTDLHVEPTLEALRNDPRWMALVTAR